jgi:hypothetical protein
LFLLPVVMMGRRANAAPPPRDLKEAVANFQWTWYSYEKAKAKADPHAKGPDDLRTVFRADGLQVWNDAHLTERFHWHWRITGPTTLVIAQDGKALHDMTLTFDSTFTHFTGHTGDGKYAEEGQRLADAASNLTAVTPGGAITPTPAVAVARSGGGGAGGSAGSALEKSLLRKRWTWPDGSGKTGSLLFQQGGVVVYPGHWTGRWEIVDAARRIVVIHAPFSPGAGGGPAAMSDLTLTFDAGLTAWHATATTGTRLDGRVDGVNQVETLQADFLDLTNMILAPLEQTPPVELRNQIIRLKEGLKDEGANAAQASPAAYTEGEVVCDMLVNALEQREVYIRRLTGGQAVPGKVPDLWAKGWADAGTGMRRSVEIQYGKFRDGLRTSAAGQR